MVHQVFFFLAAFLGTAVEVVEMMTILLGVGMTSGWRPTLLGAGAGFVLLAAIVAGLGPALTLIPIDPLRATIGVLLLLFGLQWFRKGIFRVGVYGFKPRVRKQEARTERLRPVSRIDWSAFVVAFKGVLLEGLEVVFIVVTFGAATHHQGLAIFGAVAAFLVVATVSVFVRRLLRDIPEHVIKFAVGLLLATFGTFWAVEGLGLEWPGEDGAIVGILMLYLVYSIVCFAVLARVRGSGGGHLDARRAG